MPTNSDYASEGKKYRKQINEQQEIEIQTTLGNILITE